jgi:hypothetical protein
MYPVAMESPSGPGSHLQTLIVCKLGFNQNSHVYSNSISENRYV